MKLASASAGRLEGNIPRYIGKWSFSKASARFKSTGPESGRSQVTSKSKVRDPQADREFFVDVLSSNATKRDAKSYLSKYVSSKPARHRLTEDQTVRNVVNLGRLYPHSDSRQPGSAASSHGNSGDAAAAPAATATATRDAEPSLRIAVAVIRSASTIDDDTLKGIGRTLAQLSRLGLGCIVIVEDDLPEHSNAHGILAGQVERVVEAVESGGRLRAARLDRLFRRNGPEPAEKAVIDVVKLDKIYQALEQDVIVVTAPLVYGDSGNVLEVNTNSVALALAQKIRHGTAKEFGIATNDVPRLSLERLIVIDPRGGLPHISRGGSHVFVNLEQEFEDIRYGLQTLLAKNRNIQQADIEAFRDVYGATEEEVSSAAAIISAENVQGHLDNLVLARDALQILPPTSSALIVTPAAAAYSATLPVSGVGTRSQRNPLIHNLLTDKPLFSSSLPRQRLSAFGTKDVPTNHPSMLHAPPTHLKHGMPVFMLPDPVSMPWSPPKEVTFSLSLEDPRIDQARLVALIEDSFGRRLDVDDYFTRIRPRLAGIIIAGDYDGGAILTWEQPRSFRPDKQTLAPTPTPGNPGRLVPYLDKFAVLRRAQGGGVADVVFSAMVRRCFPKGVCWRSRNGNPVNKWYFERSRGSFRLPLQKESGQAWTMFWTTEDLQPERFDEYAEVCLAVKSSWADNKKTPG